MCHWFIDCVKFIIGVNKTLLTTVSIPISFSVCNKTTSYTVSITNFVVNILLSYWEFHREYTFLHTLDETRLVNDIFDRMLFHFSRCSTKDGWSNSLHSWLVDSRTKRKSALYNERIETFPLSTTNPVQKLMCTRLTPCRRNTYDAHS